MEGVPTHGRGVGTRSLPTQDSIPGFHDSVSLKNFLEVPCCRNRCGQRWAEVIIHLPPPGALRKSLFILLMRQETSFVGTTFPASPACTLLYIPVYLCYIQGTLGRLNPVILELQGEATQTAQIKPTYFT